jgi:hypothetical protein
MGKDSKEEGKSAEAAAREARLAAALRANLKRRKAAAGGDSPGQPVMREDEATGADREQD